MNIKIKYPRALEIAELAHFGQFRRKRKNENGEPENYIEHPKRIAAHFKDDFIKTVAVLHDAIEDAPEFFDIIKKEFSEEVLRAVLILTHNKNETYFDYILRIRDSQNVTAVNVKLQDLSDNMATIEEGSKKDKYRFAFYILENVL